MNVGKVTKILILKTVVAMANLALEDYSDGAEDQNDINEMTTLKNWAINELKKCNPE